MSQGTKAYESCNLPSEQTRTADEGVGTRLSTPGADTDRGRPSDFDCTWVPPIPEFIGDLLLSAGEVGVQSVPPTFPFPSFDPYVLPDPPYFSGPPFLDIPPMSPTSANWVGALFASEDLDAFASKYTDLINLTTSLSSQDNTVHVTSPTTASHTTPDHRSADGALQPVFFPVFHQGVTVESWSNASTGAAAEGDTGTGREEQPME
ncbi:hypothetical protein AURDEDRAFT_159335 [Auricularia subglabra TFB-10046 SS5]|nr:hypothetical protein AURDEDRAFT_159335 [Auricularia subglabra TFB-10046 SS5]